MTDVNEAVARILTMPRNYETGLFVQERGPGCTSLLDQFFIHEISVHQDFLEYDDGQVVVVDFPPFGNWEVEGQFTETVKGHMVTTINRHDKQAGDVTSCMTWIFCGPDWVTTVKQRVGLDTDEAGETVRLRPVEPDRVTVTGNGLAAANYFGVRAMDIFAVTGIMLSVTAREKD